MNGVVLVWAMKFHFDPRCSLGCVLLLRSIDAWAHVVVVFPMSRCSAVVSVIMLEVLAGFVKDLAAFLEAHLQPP